MAKGTLDTRILKALSKGSNSAAVLADALDEPVSAVKAALARLNGEKKVRHNGLQTKASRWILVQE